MMCCAEAKIKFDVFVQAEELFSMLLGRFDFTQLKEADRLLGPFFFIAFTFLVTFILLNMFIAILDGSIKKVSVFLPSHFLYF